MDDEWRCDEVEVNEIKIAVVKGNHRTTNRFVGTRFLYHTRVRLVSLLIKSA